MTTRPTPAQILAARNKRVPDLIGPEVRLLVCGINPSLYTAAVGFHFARPGNRFWPALARAGITPRVLSPDEQAELLPLGYGITNIVSRATRSADELSADELRRGVRRLERKMGRYDIEAIGVLGATAYRVGWGRQKAALGRQSERFAGAELWVLPNPSGLNAHYQVEDLARFYRQFADRR